MGYLEIQHMTIYEASLASMQKKINILKNFIEDVEGTEDKELLNVFKDQKERCEEVVKAYQIILKEMNR